MWMNISLAWISNYIHYKVLRESFNTGERSFGHFISSRCYDTTIFNFAYTNSPFNLGRDPNNLQANVSATIRLFGGDSSHTPFFEWQRFQDNTLYPLAIIHMEQINVLDFDDKSERNLCFSFGNSGIVFNGASAQLFPPREKW